MDRETLQDAVIAAVVKAMQPYDAKFEKQGEQMSKLAIDIVEIQTIVKEDKGRCPQNCPCQTRINDQNAEIVEIKASAKSAHKRLDTAWKITTLIGTIAGMAAGAGVAFGYMQHATKMIGG